MTDVSSQNRSSSGRYRVVRKLGGGGMADVYLAEDTTLGRRVALKVLLQRFVDDATFVERFRREAKAAAGLNHPNLVSIYDWGEVDGTYYIVMEYVEGETLKDCIRRRGRLQRQRGGAHRAAAAGGARLRPPQRHRPPRHQVAEHHHRPRQAGEGHGLRHRPGRRLGHDRGRLHPRHGAVPGARAGQGRAGRRAHRPVLGRHRALRDAHRRGALQGRQRRHRGAQARQRAAAGAGRAGARACRTRSTRSCSRRSPRTPAQRYAAPTEFARDLRAAQAGGPLLAATFDSGRRAHQVMRRRGRRRHGT